MIGLASRNLADATVAVINNDEETPTVERVEQVLLVMRAAMTAASGDISDGDFEAARNAVLSRLVMVMQKGVAVTAKFEPWLHRRKAEMPTYYWQRFRSHLIHDLGWGFKVVRALDETVDELLDYAGNPEASGTWKRRGLVVGNVQSGKTATYTALCNKAADAGYRLIILLAGTLNSLRYQTQERLDLGFVGFDRSIAAQPGNGTVIGVGRYDNSHAPHAFTTKISDFNANTLNVRTRLDGLSQPALMVIKKNKTVLNNLHRWLKDFNPSATGTIDVPLLLIDDEADAASVNTGDEYSPRAINEGIRKLLTLFSRSSYVGFTATPFANVFISPDTVHATLESDLFPKDYIYNLEPPSNYIGPVTMFLQEPEAFLRFLDDAEPIFPQRHKKDLVIERLPESLIDAVYTFLLVNAIRDLRGQVTSHRSMLVNVSWANKVQMQVADLIRKEVEQVLSDLRSYALLPLSDALSRSRRLERLRAIWQQEFLNLPYEFADVLSVLFDAVKAVDVRSVNMISKTSRLDYDANTVHGLRVIAVGGNALSRGLTLEGLSTSYIYRNSQAYDTLLQMGRWFGYRPEYEDLCRVWLTPQAAGWYSHITEATEELRSELRRMHRENLTPEQFGLRVRAHPNALIVTARNKMRSALEVIESEVNLSAQRLETVHLPIRRAPLESNAAAVQHFLEALRDSSVVGPIPAKSAGVVWKDVPKALICSLLREFQVAPVEMKFQPSQIATYLEDNNIPELSAWDVTIASGRKDNDYAFAGINISRVQRGLIPDTQRHSIDIYKIRLGTARDEEVGLSSEQIQNAEMGAERDNSSHVLNYYYRLARGKPLLTIYFIKASNPDEIQSGGKALERAPCEPFVALSASFPPFLAGASRPIIYQANKVWQQMRLSLEAEIDEDAREEADNIAG